MASSAQLPHLETFARAAELRSFTAAARTLCLTQAAVSQRIHALEKTLGKSLFQRRAGRVLVTPAGQKLYAYALQILDLHRQARQEIEGHEAPVAGELAIAASSIPGEQLLPAALALFHKKHPHIHVRAAVSDSMTVLAQVEQGQVSLGLVGRKTDNPHLEFSHLASDRMVLVVPADHPLRRRRTLRLRQLCRYPFILRESGSGLRHSLEKALERAGMSAAELDVALELGSNEAIKEAVVRGVGVAVLSTFAVHKELEAGKLHAVAVSDLDGDRNMFIVYDRRQVLPPPARQFLQFLLTNPIPDPAYKQSL